MKDDNLSNLQINNILWLGYCQGGVSNSKDTNTDIMYRNHTHAKSFFFLQWDKAAFKGDSNLES